MTDLFNFQCLHLCEDMGGSLLPLLHPCLFFLPFPSLLYPLPLLGIQPCLWAERPREAERETDIGAGAAGLLSTVQGWENWDLLEPKRWLLVVYSEDDEWATGWIQGEEEASRAP